MIKRIVEISNPAHLHLRRNQLVVQQDDKESGQIPIEDLAVLILDHAAITLSQALLVSCFENNVVLVICDARHHPDALLSPLSGHSLHSKILPGQISATEPTKKRLWQAIVQAKIREQGRVLASATGEPSPLMQMAVRVKSGDPDNLEAQAARIYWQRLFGKSFRRDPDGAHANPLLNYAYSIIRAAVARAIVGAGLHPALGIQHRNQYNAFCLADDLMEPLRPLADIKVYELCNMYTEPPDLDKSTKAALISILGWDVQFDGRSYPLMVALHLYAASVRDALTTNHKQILIPSR